MKSRLYYLAHPVGPNDLNSYEENIEDGKNWWTALICAGYTVCAPWLGLCWALDDSDPADRKLGMDIDKAVLDRCDGIILTGAMVSSGMQEEWNLATKKGLPVFSVVGMSIEQGLRNLDRLMEQPFMTE